MVGTDIVGITQYSFWMAVAIIVMLIVIFAAKNRMSLVPKGRFVNGFEYLVEFVRNDILLGTIGPKGDKHGPFLMTLFFFILFNDIVGVIPGCKPGTGTIGVTVALALCSFCYFVWVAIKHLGVAGYIKSFAPAGVVAPLAIFVACIEVFSTILRLITLAIRLFANMFAGHVCLGRPALDRLVPDSRYHLRHRDGRGLYPGLRLHGPVGRVHPAGRGRRPLRERFGSSPEVGHPGRSPRPLT